MCTCPDYSKPKIFFVRQPWRPAFFQTLEPPFQVFYCCYGPELVLKKAKKHASYKLAIHTVILHKSFWKRVLDVFKWTFWHTSFHQVLCCNKGVLYLSNFMSSKTFLLTSIPENRLCLHFQPQKFFSSSLLFAVRKCLLGILASLF